MRATNPLRLDHARSFPAWSVDDEGTRVSLFWPAPLPLLGTLRFHVADEPDAVHVLVTESAEPPPVAQPWEEYDGMALTAAYEYEIAELRLPSALAGRPLVDASAGVARPRVVHGTDFRQRFLHDDRHWRVGLDPQDPAFAGHRWDYPAEGHRIVRFVPPPGHPDESRSAPAAGLIGDPPGRGV